MSDQPSGVISHPRVQIENVLPQLGQHRISQEIIDGLSASQKRIASKFFYDSHGSKLFKRITQLPEYYPTRTEMYLIKQFASKLKEQFDFHEIIEIGSGDASKISILLNQVADQRSLVYRPVDVSQSAMEEAAQALIRQFPTLKIQGLVADFFTQLELLPAGGKRLICFFGSTIGNFDHHQAQALINQISARMHPGDELLLGLDRVKDKHVLEAAYNDKQTITAQFNLNSLKVVNHHIGSNFDQSAFEHDAFYNEQEARIEMHLKAKKKMTITSPYLASRLSIRAGETIHTENSYKFTDRHIARLAQSGGLKVDSILTDSKQWFGLVQFSKPFEVDDVTN